MAENEQPMVERVARALFKSTYGFASEEVAAKQFAQMRESQRDVLFRQARAAIATMREPTEAVLLAGYNELTMEDTWAAMIDAALKEG